MHNISKTILSILLSMYISVPSLISSNTNLGITDDDKSEKEVQVEEMDNVLNETYNLDSEANKILQVIMNDEETSCEVILNFASTKEQNITFGVWSKTKGQDDLKWYNATRSGSQYKAIINLLDHKTFGLYYVDAYTLKNNIPAEFISGTTFSLTAPTVNKISCSSIDAKNNSFNVILDNIYCPSGFSELKFAIWTKNGSQDDLKWESCDPIKISTGMYTSTKTIFISDHKNELGEYCVDVYGKTNNGFNGFISGALLNIKYENGKINCSVNSTETTVDLTLIDASFPADWNITYAVWSKNGSQADLNWYNAGNIPPYKFEVDIKKHKKADTYYVDAYAKKSDGKKSFLCGSTFVISNNSIESVSISNINLTEMNFTVNLNNINSPSGLTELKMAVWSANGGQDDLKWYYVNIPADKQFSFSTQYIIDMKYHKENVGVYYIDVYAKSNNGISGFLNGTLANIIYSYDKYTCELDDAQTKATANIQALKSHLEINVIFYVWSKKYGQDDLKSYSATKDSESNYTACIDISKHKTTGLYYSDAYIKIGESPYRYLESTTFTVNPPTAENIYTDKIQVDTGNFRINLKQVKAPQGIKYVDVAVWSDINGQDDLRWYRCSKDTSENDYYIDISIINHKYNYGIYYMDAYATTNNDSKDFIIGSKSNITIKDNTINLKIDDSEMNIIGTINNKCFSEAAVFNCAVWSDSGGQDDLFWYDAKYTNNNFVFSAPIANHKKLGKYFADIYYTNAAGKMCFLDGSTTEYETNATININISNIDGNKGTFDIDVTEVNVPAGITAVQTPTWNKSQDISEAYTYDAIDKGGVFKSTVNVINHKLLFGTYLTDVYITMGNGVKTFIDDYSEEIIASNYINITYIGNSFYKAVAAGMNDKTITLIEFPTWSEDSGGQDDLIYHRGICADTSTNTWDCIFSINAHRPAGPHITDPCANYNDGRTRKWLGSTLKYDVPEDHFVNGTPLLHGIRNGIDVSEHQNWINWTSVANSWQVGYAIARIGFGWNAINGRADDWWETNYANARANGIPLGGYWYSYATNVAEAQAEAWTCLSILNGRPMDLPIAYDLEQYPGIDAATNTAMINAFCSIIASAGYTPMVYASESWFNGKFNVSALTGNIYFWVAQWTREPIVGRQEMVKFWQTSSTGSISGISGSVDTNYCYY